MDHRPVSAPIAIRPETAADVDAIGEVTQGAFRALENSSHTEQFIVKALRATAGFRLMVGVRGNVVRVIAWCYARP